MEDALGLRLGLLREHDRVGVRGPACYTRLELESKYLTFDQFDRFNLQRLKQLNVGAQEYFLVQDTDHFEPQVEVVRLRCLLLVFLEDFKDVLADCVDEIDHLARVVVVALEGLALLIHNVQAKSDLVERNGLLIFE